MGTERGSWRKEYLAKYSCDIYFENAASKKSFFERFSIAFSKPQLWEKCRELSILLPHGTPNELHAVFGQICGDIFGYGAGGVGFGWDLASLSRSSGSQYSHYGGLTKSYRD